ncbi:hypothetical protein R3W88_019359 [Solanum pinnatisectum]|uniref:Reverse transcriptase zinc-binding domain-containing protein n=1 Tax=Solanum pinnatisectum TaxID=50273 RepID=A0AAV9KJA4_9SOLN|nr:hypothetical protein R3W88_019359 [Solanum pinnatisectum]
MYVDHVIDGNFEDVNQLRLDGRWNNNLMTDLIGKNIIKDPQKDIMFIWEKGLLFKISFLIWRIWFKMIPIGKVLVRSRITDHLECCCCDNNILESFNHLFVLCPDANYIQKLFAGAIGQYQVLSFGNYG